MRIPSIRISSSAIRAGRAVETCKVSGPSPLEKGHLLFGADSRAYRAEPGWLDSEAEWSRSTPRQSGKKRVILAPICDIITPKVPKNGQKMAKIGEFQLLIS